MSCSSLLAPNFGQDTQKVEWPLFLFKLNNAKQSAHFEVHNSFQLSGNFLVMKPGRKTTV